MPSISVVMCAYNAAAFITPAIQSILDQTFKDFELLIVDDASTDTTREIIEAFKDPRIRVFYHQKNRGSGAARNTALREAKGEYIALMDADDFSLPTRLAAQKRYLDKHKKVGMLACTCIRMEGRKLWCWYRFHSPKDVSGGLLLSMFFANPTLMVRHDIIRQHAIYYREDFKYGEAEDYDWVMRLLPYGKAAALIWPRFVYRVRAGSQYYANKALSWASSARISKAKIQALFPDARGYGSIKPDDIPDFLHCSRKINQVEEYEDLVKTTAKLLRDLQKVAGGALPLQTKRFVLQRLLEAGRGSDVKVPKGKIVFLLMRHSPDLLVARMRKQYFGLFLRWVVKHFYVPSVRRRLEAYGAFEASSK